MFSEMHKKQPICAFAQRPSFFAPQLTPLARTEITVDMTTTHCAGRQIAYSKVKHAKSMFCENGYH
jgi:hypothetical protein